MLRDNARAALGNAVGGENANIGRSPPIAKPKPRLYGHALLVRASPRQELSEMPPSVDTGPKRAVLRHDWCMDTQENNRLEIDQSSVLDPACQIAEIGGLPLETFDHGGLNFHNGATATKTVHPRSEEHHVVPGYIAGRHNRERTLVAKHAQSWISRDKTVRVISRANNGIVPTETQNATDGSHTTHQGTVLSSAIEAVEIKSWVDDITAQCPTVESTVAAQDATDSNAESVTVHHVTTRSHQHDDQSPEGPVENVQGMYTKHQGNESPNGEDQGQLSAALTSRIEHAQPTESSELAEIPPDRLDFKAQNVTPVRVEKFAYRLVGPHYVLDVISNANFRTTWAIKDKSNVVMHHNHWIPYREREIEPVKDKAWIFEQSKIYQPLRDTSAQTDTAAVYEASASTYKLDAEAPISDPHYVTMTSVEAAALSPNGDTCEVETPKVQCTGKPSRRQARIVTADNVSTMSQTQYQADVVYRRRDPPASSD